MVLFANRREAGEELAARLAGWADRHDAIVLALPRGGVPVGFEVARRLRLPLDVFVVRKLGVPGREELAMGALATGGVVVLDRDLIRHLGIEERDVARVVRDAWTELARRARAFRPEGGPPPVAGRDVILVDDGLATGSTMRAAVAALRQLQPRHIVVAAPVGSERASSQLAKDADEVVCLHTPEPFYGVGQFYRDFNQTSDAEVHALLDAAQKFPPMSPEIR